MQSDVGLASPLLRRSVSALDGRPESGSSTLLSEAGRSKGAGAVLWLASSCQACCLSNCDREIAALAEIKTGHPLKGVCLCATRVGGGDIGFDGPFMRPEFFCRYCRFPRVVYSILRHQRRCVDLALVKLCIALNSFHGGDGCVRNITRSEEYVAASLCCILLSRGVIVVPVRKLEIQFGIEAGSLAAFRLRQSFPFGVSRK